MKKIRKPFSIEAYKTGRYAVTNGYDQKVEVLTTDCKIEDGEVIAQVLQEEKWSVVSYTKDGHYLKDKPCKSDLVLVINVYDAGDVVTLQQGERTLTGILRTSTEEGIEYHLLCYIASNDNALYKDISWHKKNVTIRPATEEEKVVLMQKITDNGLVYDATTNTLKKREKPPVAQIVEYEPIGKVYASGAVVINLKMTREQRIKVIKALADTL